MPELPEVETIKRGLQAYLVGHRIDAIDIRLSKMLTGEKDRILGAMITAVRRLGKGLVIDLDNAFSIAIHIKMTGQLIYKGSKVPTGIEVSKEKVGRLPSSHTHLVVALDQGAKLYYNDFRQFGWIKILPTEAVADVPFFKALGPEPLKDLDLATFTKIVQRSKGPIKPLLMDQKRIAGIGNIYANDGLFRAKIDPRRKASSLTGDEIQRLISAIEEVLKKGLEAGGSSEWSYVNALGQTGGYQKLFLVYGQAGKPCIDCGTPIEKIQFGGRGTFFCPHCQF